MVNQPHKHSHYCRSCFTSPRGYVTSWIYPSIGDPIAASLKVLKLKRFVRESRSCLSKFNCKAYFAHLPQKKKQRLSENEERAGVESSRSRDEYGQNTSDASTRFRSNRLCSPRYQSDVLSHDPLSIFREWRDDPLNNKIESWGRERRITAAPILNFAYLISLYVIPLFRADLMPSRNKINKILFRRYQCQRFSNILIYVM